MATSSPWKTISWSWETCKARLTSSTNMRIVLNRLQERGISDSLLGEISMMDLDSAIAYGEELLGYVG